MNQEQFLQYLEFKVQPDGLTPAQIETGEWLELQKLNKSVFLKQIEPRDLGMHKSYFKIISYIYDRLPMNFKAKIEKKYFYKFLKTLNNEFDIVFEFKDGRQMIEYKSISFSKMNQVDFRIYFNNQLSVIYEELLIPLNKDYLMDEINELFEKQIAKLI